MPENQYPVFEGGQTLTAADLNLLRGFLHDRDRLLGRLVGFGISCGLEGTVASAQTTLTIGAGLAVDQRGEPLLLDAPATIPLPAVASGGTFDFVAAGPGGFSVVLEATDTVEPAPDCGEADCDGHAELHTRAVALRVVPGRITGTFFDFPDDPLFAVEPLRLSVTSNPQGSYNTLRDALVNRLNNDGSALINAALIVKLQGTSIPTTDLPGVKGYKAGFINEVLFATLDLLRCRSLSRSTCRRTAVRPGVVLGWLSQAGGTWTWDCGYRHAWEPPAGLTQAFAGGSCADPCDLFRDEVEALISAYAPPDPPPAGGGGKPGPFKVCKKGERLFKGKCIPDFYRTPPKEIDELVWKEKIVKDPRVPIWYPPDREHLVLDIYGTDDVTYLGSSVIEGTPALGYDALAAQAEIAKTIRENEGTPNVKVVTATEVGSLDGYEPASSFGFGDEIVLTKDAGGTVIATGRVPAAHTARTVGTALPEASAKATAAIQIAEGQKAAVDSVQQTVQGLAGDVAGFASFQQSTSLWQGQVDQKLGGLDAVIVLGVEQVVGSTVAELQRRVATVEGSVDILKQVRTSPGLATGGTAGLRLDQDFAHGMTEFAGTVNAGLSSLVTEENERTLGRYIGDTTRAAAKLDDAAAGGDPADIGEAAVTLMSSLRTAVKAAGVDPGLAKQLDAQYNAVRGLLG